MGLTGFYNAPISVEDGIAIVKEAFNKGITFFDTADVYGKDGSNEHMIGQVTPDLLEYNVLILIIMGCHYDQDVTETPLCFEE